MDLQKLLRAVRPGIANSSLKTYASNIKKLAELMKVNTIQDIDFLANIPAVLQALKSRAPTTRKNYLVAVLVALMSDADKHAAAIEKVNKEISDLSKQVGERIDNNQKSERQKANWVEYSDVVQLFNKLKLLAKPLLKKNNDELSRDEKQTLQDYLLISLYSGKYFAPVRNDFANMEIINSEEDADKNKNYLVIYPKKLEFLLRDFKTRKAFDEKQIPIKSPVLIDLIMKWLDVTGKDTLLVNLRDDTPMTENGITKNLNRIFQSHLGKTISSSMLRAIYISHKNKQPMTMRERKKLAEDMHHSVNMQMGAYTKVD